MRILVTGAGGFVGAAVARAASSAGHAVFGTVRPGGNLVRIEAAPGVITVPLDLRDPAAITDTLSSLRPDMLIHSAWTNVTGHKTGDPRAATADIEAACTLVSAGIAAGLSKFVGIGSQAEYGLRDTPENESPIEESLLPEPRSLYGAAKLATLALTRQLCAQAGLPFAWLRLFATYGPGDNPSWLIPSLIDQMLAGIAPRTTAGLQRCDYLYIDDAAAGILAAATRPEATGVFNLGSGIPVRVRDIVQAICYRAAPDLTLTAGEIPYGPNQVWHMQARIDRLCAATGWSPSIDLQTGLDRTIAWHRDCRAGA